MNLVLLNVKYSPNLGDGIIAECLEETIREVGDGVCVKSCDLAGRTAFGEGMNQSRRLVYAVLEFFPKSLRRQIVAQLLKRIIQTRLRHHYSRALEGADVALIGGGQLIADAYLNFPLKIAAAADRARHHGVALGVYGVGVGGNFSPEAQSLLSGALGGDLACVRVRDQISLDRWSKQFGGGDASIVSDPGMLSSKVYGPVKRPERTRPLIGVGITNPSTLSLHAETGTLGKRDWKTFFVTLTEILAAEGYDVQLFTNGARDDHRFAQQVCRGVAHALTSSGVVKPAAPLRKPTALAHLIASFDGIIAHRLHAAIVAYSYGIPHVGLGWDTKMQGFFGDVGRSEFLVSDCKPGAYEVAALAKAALTAGIDDEQRRTKLNSTRREIRAMVRHLGKLGYCNTSKVA